MGTWGYTYDALNRLSTAVSSAGTYSGLTLTESYDAYGNRENQVPSGSYNGPVPSASLLTFTGNNNRVDQWGYDASGEVLNDGTNMYQYDAEGHQTGTYNTLSGLTGYVYDAEGNRVMKVVVNGFGTPHPTTTVTKEYLLGPGGEQISVLDGSGTWQWTNVYAGGKQLATYDSAGTHFTITDWLGTKRMQLGVTGASTVTVDEQCASLPYGDGLDCTGSDVNKLYFTGKERDTESNNDYFLARFYSSDSGRLLIPDWSKNPQSVPYADYNNPQTLNLYGYVGNNPLSKVDADGHGYICFSCLAHSAGQYAASHPRTMQALKGMGQVFAGVAGVGVSATAEVGSVGTGTVGVIFAVQGSVSTGVMGIINIAGAATKTDVSAVEKPMAAVSNPAGQLVTAFTGSADKGAQAAAIGDAVVTGANIKNLGEGSHAARAIKTVQTALSAKEGVQAVREIQHPVMEKKKPE